MFAIAGAVIGGGAALAAGAGAATALGAAGLGLAAGSALGSISQGGQAADAATQAANVQAAAQLDSLNYLKEREKIPQQFREGALTKLGGISGLTGGVGNQQELIDRAKNSPLYSSIMGGRKAGEAAILRNASATGGLRSGNASGSIYEYNTDLATKALLESYNQQLQGLQGLAQLPSNANTIASGISGVGTTQAQGITAAAQANQQGWGNAINSGLTGLSYAAQMWPSSPAPTGVWI